MAPLDILCALHFQQNVVTSMRVGCSAELLGGILGAAPDVLLLTYLCDCNCSAYSVKGIFRVLRKIQKTCQLQKLKANVELAFGCTVTLVLMLGLKGRKCPSSGGRQPHDRLDVCLYPFLCSGVFCRVFVLELL